MITVVLKTPIFKSMTYKQGIECAMNLADAGDEVRVFLANSFLEDLSFLKEDDANLQKVRKQIKQLELYDIPLYSAKHFESSKIVLINDLVKDSKEKVVVF